MRKKIEELFGEAKEYMGLRRARYRGLRYVREQVLMTAAAQNIKRLIKLLSRGGPKLEMIAMRARKEQSIEELYAVARSLIHFVADMLRVKAGFFAEA